MKLEQKPKVVFTPSAWRKMFAYARSVDTEICGFGEVELRKGTYFIKDTYIFPQIASGGYVKIDNGALLDWMSHCKREGRQDRVENSRLWWHSHVNMSCFRSGTDNGTIEDLLTSMPYVLSCVVNKQFQYELSLHLKDPVRVTFNNMNPYVDRVDLGVLERDCDREARKMVKREEPVRRLPEPIEGVRSVWTKEDIDAWKLKHGYGKPVTPGASQPTNINHPTWDRYSPSKGDEVGLTAEQLLDGFCG